MAKSRRIPAGQRNPETRGGHASRGSHERRLEPPSPEDDPLRDLRPVDVEPEPMDPGGDEFVWPEMQDGDEDDD